MHPTPEAVKKFLEILDLKYKDLMPPQVSASL